MKEHQHIEWKETWRDDYLRWIAGFANAEGGVLVIGRNDKGKAVGVADARKLLVDLPNKVRDLLGIMVDVNLRTSAGCDYLEIAVPSYPNPISYRGEYYYRSGSTNQTLKGKTIDLLLTKYLKAGISYLGIQRVETFPVPEDALREAVLNAVIHKDYASGVPIQISVYNDKLMVWNSGELPQDWTVAKLKGKHPSHPFNPDVANAFFRAGQIEAWGRGIERIVEACRGAGAPEPELRYEGAGLWVEFPFPQDRGERADQEPTQKTTQNILQILALNPSFSRREIAEALGDVSEHGVKYHLERLKASAISTVSDRIGAATGRS